MPRLKAFRWDAWTQWTLTQVLTDLPGAIAVDTETTGLRWQDRAFCATCTWRDPAGRMKSAYIDLESEGWEARRDQLRGILEWVPVWIFHNAKFDLERLAAIGALPGSIAQIEDTQPLASILNENRRMALKVLAVEELGIDDTIEVEIKSGPNRGKTKRVPKEQHHLNAARRKLGLTKDDGYDLLPREVLIPYAIRDTELTLLLWEKLRPQLPEAWEPVYAEEIQVIHALWKMESNGIGVDAPYLQVKVDEYGVEVMRLWQDLVAITGNAEFNPNSPAQLLVAFKLFGVELTSTDKAAMRDLLADPATPSSARELAETLHAYREAEKIHGTYLTSLLAEQVDGVAHPWINAVGPRTGRFSSSKASN